MMKKKMGKVLEEVLKDQPDATRQVIYDVLKAEQNKIDMVNPAGILKDVQKAVDDQVRREEGKK
jgi:hypothetical protein